MVRYGWNQAKLLRSLLGGTLKALERTGRGEDEEEDGGKDNDVHEVDVLG